MVRGTGVSEGIGIGFVHILKEQKPVFERHSITDVEKELERLGKEKARLEGEIKRGEGMLSNPNFVEKAPEAKVNAEKEKLAKYKETYAQVCERIDALK